MEGITEQNDPYLVYNIPILASYIIPIIISASRSLTRLAAVVILDGFYPARPFLGGKIFLQWADTSNVLPAVKYLGETEIVNRSSGETGHLIHGIRSPLDIQMDAGATQQR